MTSVIQTTQIFVETSLRTQVDYIENRMSTASSYIKKVPLKSSLFNHHVWFLKNTTQN